MPFHGRAYYNSLQLAGRDCHDKDVQSWQVENYRLIETETLFERLEGLDITLDREGFVLYSKSVESPHELMLNLVPNDASALLQEKVFLLVFELWRRFVTEKLSLSVFCDEFDHQIELYEQGDVDDELLGVMLARLESILDGSVDQEQSPIEVFKLVKTFFAHNFEDFLYDFCTHLIDIDRRTLASEMIEGYYDYIEDKPWFDFLRMRMLAEEDLVEADEVIARFFVNMMDTPNFELGLELLEFLAKAGKSQLFYNIYQTIVPLVQTEDDFKQMLKTVASFYSDVDFEMEHDFVHKLLSERSDIDPAERKKLEQVILETLDQK